MDKELNTMVGQEMYISLPKYKQIQRILKLSGWAELHQIKNCQLQMISFLLKALQKPKQ